jgi:hypothetical protein
MNCEYKQIQSLPSSMRVAAKLTSSGGQSLTEAGLKVAMLGPEREEKGDSGDRRVWGEYERVLRNRARAI